MRPQRLVWLVLALALILISACDTTTPTAPPSPTAIPTATATVTPTPTPPPSDFTAEAATLLKASDFEGAAAAYAEAIATDADYAPAYAGLSQVYLWQSVPDYDAALEQAEQAVSLDPDDAMNHAILALIHTYDLNGEEALEAAEQAAELEPENAFVQAVLGQAYLLDRQYDAALAAAEQAYALDPEQALVVATLGEVYDHMGDFPRALAAYQKAMELEPDFVPAQAVLGWFWLKAERYDEAVALFEAVIEDAPDFASAHLGLARAHLDRHEYEAAEERLAALEEIAPEYPGLYRERGHLLSQQEQYDEALEQYKLALELVPDSYYSALAIGYTYLDQEECSRGEQEFQALIDAHPRLASAHEGLGSAKLCDGDATKALEYFRKAVELEPYNAQPHVSMGSAYALQERWQDAIESFVEALRWSAAPSRIHQFLGAGYRGQQMVDEAEAEFEIALAHNPYLQDARSSLAELLWAQDKTEEAYAMAQEAYDLNPLNQESQLLLGVLAVDAGDYDKGVELLEGVLEEEPEQDAALYFLGIAYCELGDYAEAKETLETYQALAGEGAPSQISNLLVALEQGYTLTEEKAIEDIDEYLESFLEQMPSFVVEESEAGSRTMVATVPLEPADLERENANSLFFKVGVVGAMAGLRLPQIDPPVDNGLLMSFELYGQERFTVSVSLDELKDLAYGLIGYEEFVQILDFSRMVSSSQANVQTIARQVSELRELSLDAQIPFESLDRDELREHLSEGIDAQANTAMDNDATLLALLGVIEPTLDLTELMVDLQTEQVAGFYTPEEKAMYLIETEEQTASDELVIAHEYVHALQDHAFGLDALSDEAMNDDQAIAFRAMVEGDATLAMYLYANDYVPAVDMLNMIYSASGVENETLDASPVFIQEITTFPYVAGLNFVVTVYQRGGWDAVNELYENPPQSTEQILHPERYWQEDTARQVKSQDPLLELEGAWAELDADVMGELGLYLSLATHVGPAAASQAAEGWGGDHYRLLQNGDDGPSALLIYSIWDDADEADDFAALTRATMAHRRDYAEVVNDLVGEVGARWWLSDEGCVYMVQEDESVTLIIATDQETAQAIIDSSQ